MNLRDLAERLVWTFVAASGAGATAATFFDVDARAAALMAGLTATINLVTVVARKRLAVLPDPGAGLPGLPTGDR